MNKIVIAFILLLVGSFQVMAQISHTTSGDVDVNAQKILSKAASKMNAAPVSFSVTLVNKDSKKVQTSKETFQILFNKGKYRVTAKDQILYSDGKSVWHFNKSAKEVMLSSVSASDDDLMNPARLLSGYAKNFRARFIREEEDGVSVVDLTPKKSKSYYKVRLLVASNGMLKRMEVHNFDGTCSEYGVSDFKSGVSCSDGDFMFDASANKGVEVIDMR